MNQRCYRCLSYNFHPYELTAQTLQAVTQTTDHGIVNVTRDELQYVLT